MWHAFGSYQINENFLHYKIPTMGGQSGSPIIKREDEKEFVVGVHIGGRQFWNTAIRLNTQKKKMINEWLGKVTGRLDLGT